MSEEAAGESKHPASEAVEEEEEEDKGEDTVESPKTDNPSEEPPAPSDDPKEAAEISLVPPVEAKEEEEEGKPAGEPPMDWFEPLEDDDDDPDEESLAGETESIAGSERATRHLYQIYGYRRKRAHPEEGWVEWPVLGQGWKRKEVVRRSGSSIGQKDVYYLSPRGDRVRSRVELATVLQGTDLTQFEYKSGKFVEGEIPPVRGRPRTKKRYRDRSSSESSWMDRGDGAETPDSHHRLTPNITPRNLHSNQTSVSLNSSTGESKQSPNSEEKQSEEKIRLPFPSSSRPLSLPSIKGEFGSEESTLICAKCGISFTGTWYDKQRKRPCCPSCWATSKSIEHPLIRFRKWIPCGQCVGCHNAIDCGQCANCKHGLQSPEARKRLCRKRRCICPIRKQSPGSVNVTYKRSFVDPVDTYEDSNDVTESQHPSLKSSDTENFSANVDLDDDDMSTDDDDDRHLLPFQMAGAELGLDAPLLPGRPRPHYTYSRKSSLKRSQDQQADMDYTDDDDDDDEDSNPQPLNHSDFGVRNGVPDRFPHISNHNYSQPDHQSQWDTEKSHTGRNAPKHMEDDEDEFPMITQIFSLAENPVESGVDLENQLMKLLHSLRSSVLPILWYAIMVEGPQLQLIQCSKQSNMADTIVLIDPGFCYQVTVQKQPLLPIHPLYDIHPSRLGTATDVVSLLLSLERYVVCQGLPTKQLLFDKGPIVLERAATCDFLIKKNERICACCKALQELQIHHRE
ncbi:methyl-CpG-binding domain protein 1b isoform X3 [Poecilia reticulata]|uniref:methyl-CpG-binding domain protein 1b isoform X3 n=1 Tax=Poecilia reticulata TaxID=8081 RepID=UPI0004A29E27|nr:PREDICTED: methyl-CpG-binding domain protein 1 isoform X3 [Poecilia reticulata]